LPRYLADTSAWHRSVQVRERWSTLIRDDLLALCTPVALELLYSARGKAEYEADARDLQRFPMLVLDARGEAIASQTQAALAARGQHRGPTPVDLLIAGIAEAHGATLLHYDRHFDAIASVTGQPAEWLARPGTLD
jgi:predicted nucleic acid-binding protein